MNMKDFYTNIKDIIYKKIPLFTSYFLALQNLESEEFSNDDGIKTGEMPLTG